MSIENQNINENATTAKNSQPKEKVGIFKKILKVILYTILAIFTINAALYILLSIPYIQNKLVNYASSELSQMLKTEVRIDEVRLSLFNRVSVKGLYIEDQAKDTLAYASAIDVRIRPIDYLLKSRIRVNALSVEDLYLNVYAQDSIADYNFQFIVDEFSSSDTTNVDTTSNPLDVVVDKVQILNGRLAYRIKNVAETPNEFNPSDIQVSELNASVSVRSIDMAKLNVHVNSISAKEKSGLTVTELKGHVLSEGGKLMVEDLLFSLPNSWLKPEMLFYDLDTEEFGLKLEDGTIHPQDLEAFLPNLKYLTHDISVKLEAQGMLPSVHVSKFDVAYADDAVLKANGFITSYENLADAGFELDLTQLKLTPDAIAAFAKLGDETFEKPEMFDQLGDINLEGSLKGKLSAFELDSRAIMNLGGLALSASGSIDTTFTNYDIKAHLKNTKSFNLKPLVGPDVPVGKLSLTVDLDASQKGEGNLIAKLTGKIDTLELGHGAVEEIDFEAYMDKHAYSVGVSTDLHFGGIRARVDMTRADKPDITLNLALRRLEVGHFYTNKLWKDPVLSFDLLADIKKFDIDNLLAEVDIDHLKFVDDDFNFAPGPIKFRSWEEVNKTQNMSLTSSIASANLKGRYKFSTIADEFSELMHRYMSNIFPKNRYRVKDANNFDFDFTLYNTEQLSYIFDLPITIVEPLRVDGEINTIDRKVNLKGKLPYAKTSALDIKGMKLDIQNKDSAFNILLNSGLNTTDAKYSMNLKVEGEDNAVRATLLAQSDSADISLKGRVDMMGTFTLDKSKHLVSSFEVIPSDIKIGKFVLNMLPAHVTNVGTRTEINNLGIKVNNKKYLNIDGVVSDNKSDSLYVNFSKAQVADILQGFNINDIYAELDGSISVTNAMNTPEIYTDDFKIADITLFKDTLGTINIDSQWNQEQDGIRLESYLSKKGKNVIEFEGLIDPSKETLNLHMDMDRFSISWLKPMMEGLLSDIDGSLSSHLTIKGTFDEPITDGYLGFNDTKMGIEYTNVTYYIADTISIRPDRIGFENLILKDSQGNKGIVSANVTHRNFKNMKYSLNLRAQELMVLNTQSRTDSLFYGKLFASGVVKIEGSDKGIDLNMQIKNAKKSTLNITIPQVAEATEYNSVVYINVPPEKLPKEDVKMREPEPDIPIRIKMKLDVDPNIKLGVVIDPQTGDRMDVSGKGSINFSYDMESQLMTTYGEYNIVDGNVKLNVQNLKSLDFKIKDGSKLRFIGDPLLTKFDIIAYRRVRADLRTLDQQIFEQDDASPRVNVDCLLGISGDINKMDLSYDVQLYNASDDQMRKVNSLINTEENKIKQFAYLIVSGRFYSNTGGSGAGFSNGMWTSLASTALSSGLNAVLGKALGENWEFGADINDTDASVSASTKLFDDKLKLHANVGYRDDNAVSSANSGSSFIGDFDAEYMLNPLWTVRAYSHTNDRFDRQGTTTQGVGIVYTRDSPTFKQLFKTFRRKRGVWYNKQRRRQDSIKRALLEMDTISVDTSSLVKPVVPDKVASEKDGGKHASMVQQPVDRPKKNTSVEYIKQSSIKDED